MKPCLDLIYICFICSLDISKNPQESTGPQLSRSQSIASCFISIWQNDPQIPVPYVGPTAMYVFYIHGSVHRDSVLIRSNKMQWYASIYLLQVYMFRASIAPIIRSTKNCNCSPWYRS